MTQNRTRSRPRICLRGFAGDRKGVAAIEFALLLPIMLTLYLGSVELGNGLAVQFKATLAARTVADLASRYTQIDNSTMTAILGAASAVVAPYSSSGMVVTVSEVSTDANGKATITWSDSLHGTARAVGAAVTLPSDIDKPNISLIWGEVTYPYKPEFGYTLTGTINLYEDIYFYPRLSSSVTRVNS